MSDLTFLKLNGTNAIRFDNRDGDLWVSLSDLAEAVGKKADSYPRLKDKCDSLFVLSTVTGDPVMEVVRHGTPEERGIWGNKDVAIDFAMWCNVEVYIWVCQQIRSLLINS
jgi:hypothetical protein